MPTSHRVTLAGHQQVFAMCAIDALGMPFMLDTDAVIDSHCQQCSKPLTLHITNKTTSTEAPQEITVVYANAPANCCAATDQCPYINFFCSPEHAYAWQANQPHLTSKTSTLAEAVDVGRSIFEELLHPLEGNIQR